MEQNKQEPIKLLYLAEINWIKINASSLLKIKTKKNILINSTLLFLSKKKNHKIFVTLSNLNKKKKSELLLHPNLYIKNKNLLSNFKAKLFLTILTYLMVVLNLKYKSKKQNFKFTKTISNLFMSNLPICSKKNNTLLLILSLSKKKNTLNFKNLLKLKIHQVKSLTFKKGKQK